MTLPARHSCGGSFKMDFDRSVIVEQISSDSVLECALDNNTKLHHISNQTIHVPEEVICPEPRRAALAPYIMENLSRFWCSSKSELPKQKGHSLGLDAGVEILDKLLSKDEPEDDSDKSDLMGFFCISPPVRPNNPLVRDVKFSRQALPFASLPLGSCHGGVSSTRAEKVISCAVSFGGKPMVRIEGFISGNSESQSIVSALA